MGDATAVLLCVLVVAVLVAAVGFAVANATHMRHLTCTITDKDRAWVSSGESGHSSQRVYTDQCGVLSVVDSLWSWHFNSADTYSALKKGHTYALTTRGYRIPFLSIFPNVVDYREVTR